MILMKEIVKMRELKHIKEHSYSWAEGFELQSKVEKYPDGMRMVDWDLVKELIESGEYDRVDVGLAEDWEQTYATIYESGKIEVDENPGAGFYGCSSWATPAVKLFKSKTVGLYECWILGDDKKLPNWCG